MGVSIEEFLVDPSVIALPDTGPCLVAACTRRRRATRGSYCSAHEQRWHAKRRLGSDTDERVWRLTATPTKEPGKVSLRGLPPLVVAQVLYGVQERTTSGRKLDDFQLTALCNELRRQRVTSIADADTTGLNEAYRGMINSFAAYLRRSLLNPETERTKDVWDLAAFGYRGRLRFTGISQPWLREAAKRWALDDLPQRRGKRVGHLVSHHVGCLERLSESLRMRSDRGEVPSMLGRADIDNFLNRMTYLESSGVLSRDTRIRTCQQTKTMLSRIRALGLTRQGEPAAGLSQEFVLQTSDMPRRPDREPGRDLPPEILRQICDHLPQLEALAGPEMRAAVEILIDTGRRPDEVCSLAWDCLDRDADGKPVLIYDNDKADRPGRRLPIPEATAELITRQKQRVRARYPDTPVGELALLPARTIQQGGRRPLNVSRFIHRHREWINAIPELRTADGTPFDTTRLVAYCYRHTYAQRHADGGVPPDVLRELMNHRDLKATQGYYRVEESRRRDAVDRVSALQFDRHGNRIWRDIKALIDSEYARRAVGEVAVPYGVCSEPSNVKANGQSCPYRFRCLGCEHFRTDVSYLPDLQAHLDDLLRIRERLRAATDIDDWARADAMPSDTEITLTRGLIQRIKGDLEELDDGERADIDQAVAAVRRHRVTLLGMPRIAPSPRLQEGSA
ncbi:tyrosine-type recombinase/integrase [Mycobacterium sp.]|uniref:tyrosine-type recombinase/integrase n=1 Tax=Mycobacterium sp. TaxID=1785 RepID=UPI0031DFF1D9